LVDRNTAGLFQVAQQGVERVNGQGRAQATGSGTDLIDNDGGLVRRQVACQAGDSIGCHACDGTHPFGCIVGQKNVLEAGVLSLFVLPGLESACMFLHELRVVPFLFHQDMCQSQGQGALGAGRDGHPVIGSRGGERMIA